MSANRYTETERLVSSVLRLARLDLNESGKFEGLTISQMYDLIDVEAAGIFSALADHNSELFQLLEAVRKLAIENLITEGVSYAKLDAPVALPCLAAEVTRILQDLAKQATETAIEMYESSLVEVSK
jgi:hypothetical protein